MELISKKQLSYIISDTLKENFKFGMNVDNAVDKLMYEIEPILDKSLKMHKSDGVKDCVKWLEQQIKEKKKSNYQDNYSSIEIITMINIKISLEKYMKKLKHMANEI